MWFWTKTPFEPRQFVTDLEKFKNKCLHAQSCLIGVLTVFVRNDIIQIKSSAFKIAAEMMWAFWLQIAAAE